ncbi:MAG: leukotoxin LktA family filamentous adhesin, partial [Acidaminococcaceae bacterium]|nr:leukotoxin LktA family filamentous adhesin [Acidaminococcaceae bacterium]
MSYWNRQFKKHNNKYGLYCPGKGNDLSRQVLMALTAAGFFMTPFSAYASAITPANTTHSSTVVSNGNVHTVYVQEANGTVGRNRFTDFTLDRGNIANMQFNQKGNTATVNHLVNLVQNKIDINGTVNAVQGGTIGGHLIFASPQGIVVGASGVINAGQFSAMVPSQAHFDKLWDAGINNYTPDFISENLAVEDKGAKFEYSKETDKGIDIQGVINANGIRLAANDIKVSGTLNSQQTIDFANLVNISKTNGNGTEVKSGLDATNGKLIRTFNNTGDVILTAKMEHVADDTTYSWLPESVGSSSEQTALLPNRFDGSTASIDVSGTIQSGGKVTLTADANTTFTEELGLANFAYQMGVDTASLLSYLGLPFDASVVIKTNTSKINVGKAARITSGGDMNVAANSKLKIKLNAETGDLYNDQNVKTTATLAMAKWTNSATVDVFGKLESTGSMALKADTNTDVSAVSKAATRKASEVVNGVVNSKDHDVPDKFVGLGFLYGDSLAAVRIHRVQNAENENVNQIVSGGTFSATANLKSKLSLDVTATSSSAPQPTDDAKMSTAIGIIVDDGDARVEIDKSVRAAKIDITAKNRISDTLKATNQLGEANVSNAQLNPWFAFKQPAITSGFRSMVSSGLGSLIGKAKNRLGMEEPLGGNEGVQGLSIFDDFHPGVSFAVLGQENTASVRIGESANLQTVTQTGITPDINITANVGIDLLHINSISGENNQKKAGDSNNNPTMMLDLAVGGSRINNSASVTLEGKAGAGSGSTPTYAGQINSAGKAVIKADAEMAYDHWDAQVDAWLSSWEKLGTSVKTLLGLGSDTVPGWQQKKQNLTQLEQDLKTWKQTIDNLKTTRENGTITQKEREQLAQLGQSLYNNQTSVLDIARSVLLAGDPRQDMTLLKKAQDAYAVYKSLQGALRTTKGFLDPASYTNYYTRTTLASSNEQEGKMDLSGSLALHLLRNRAVVMAGEGTRITAAGDQQIHAGTKTNAISVTGSGGPYGTANSTTGAGAGVAASYQNMRGESLVVIGKNAELSGRNVAIDSGNEYAQRSIMYTAGVADKSGVTGMLNIMAGRSNSIVSVDDEARLNATDGNIDLQAKNDVGATGYAGGLTVGGTGSTATVGVGIDVISVDANTMAVVADNNINAYSSGSTTGMTEAQKRQEVETAIAQIRSKGEQEIASMTLSAEVKAAIAKEVDADENIAADQKATEKANREAEELNNKKERKQEEIEAQIAAKEAELARWKEEKLAAEAGYALTPAEEQEIIDAVKADTSVTEANREKEILRRQAARLSEKLDTRLSTEQKSQISDTIANEIKAEIDTLIRNGKLQESGRAEKTAELRQSEYYIDRANQLKVQALKDRNADDKVSDTIKKATALTYQILDDMTAAQYNRDKISRAPGATNPPATLTDEKNRIKTMVGSTATAAGNTTVGTMTARNVNVKAATDGSVVSLALEGAMVTNSDTGIRKVFDWYNNAGNSVGEFLNTNVERVLKIPEKWATQFLTRQIYKYEKTYPPSPNYPAQDMSDTSNHWTGVGSFAWNANDGNTLAVIDRSLIKTENLFLEATDDMLNVAVAGGGAMNWLGADRNDSYNVAGNLGLALNNGTRNVDSVLRKSRVENLTSGSLKSLSNIARKTGGDVSVGAGVSLTNASSDTQIDGGLSVSFNRSVNNTHAYLLNNTIANTGANGTVLSNYAFSGQNQFAGGINVELGFGMGEGTSYNVGGSAAYSELKNNVESGISGGSYTGMAGVDVEAVKSDKQKNIAVTASGTTAENSYGAGVSFAVGNHDNTARAFLQGVTMTVDKKGDAYVLVPAGKQTEDRYKNKTFYRKKEDGTFEAVSATNGKYTFTKKIQTTDKDGKVVTKTVTGEVTELYVRESNYDGGVRVEAGDAKNESHWQQHLAEHQLDPAGDSYFKYLNDKNYNVQKNDGGSSVWNIALGMEIAGTGGAGVGVAINAQKDTVTADLTGSQITASSVNGRALNRLDTTSVAVGAAVNTGSGNTGIRVSGSGAVSVNSTNNTNKVTFANNTVHADTVIGAAENKASILNVAVQVAAKANGAADGIAWAHNVMDNANGVYLNGGTYSQKSNNSNPLEVLLYSRNSAGVGVVAVGAAGSYGENGASPLTAVGSFALNFGANSTEAVIGNTSDQTILSGVHKLRVSASDEKMNRVTIAGAVDLANNASFGAGVSLAMTDDTVLGDDGKEKDKEKIRAEINNASITTAKKQNVNADITVNATDTSALSSAAVTFGLISAKDKTLLNGQAAASTVYSKKATRAGINNTGIDAWSSDASNDDKKGSGTSLITLNALNATDFYNISLAGALGGSKSSVGVGAAISTNRLYQTTEALYTNTAKPETISHAGNVSVAAQGTGSLFTLTSGAAASVADSIVEIGGSLAYNYINNVTRAKMSKVNLFSEDNIGVVAQSDLADFTFTGGFNVGGKFSAGASVNINSFNDTTEAVVEGSNLTAKAGGNYNSEGIAVSSDVKKEGMAQSWFDSLFASSEALKKNRVTSHKKGLIIDSSSTHAISANLVCGGGSNGFLTFDGTFAQNYIDGKTIAVLSDTNVNEAENTLNANQNVHVNAADFNNIGTFEIGVAFSINTSDANAAGGEGGNAGGGAGADGGAEGGFFARSVKAIGTFVGNRWKNFGKGLSNAGSSISGSLGNGFMASVGLTENGNTINRTVSAVVDGNTAFTTDSTVEDKHKSRIKAKNLSVTAASKKAIVNTALAAGVSLSGKSFGLAAGVNLIDHTLDGTTSTRVSNADITFDDKADIKATDSADSYLVTGNVEFVSSGAAVGASWGRLKQNATVTTDVKNSTITSTKTDSAATVSADSAINVDELLVSVGFSAKNGGSLVGTWGSTAFDTSVKTTVDSSAITADTIRIQSQDTIKNKNIGGSGNYGTYLGVGANVITSEIRNRVHTDVLNSTLTAKQALDVKAVELRDISDKVYTVSGSGGADCVGVGIGINVISVGINQPDPKLKTDQTNSNKNTQTDPEAADASAKAVLGEQQGLYQNTYAANTSYDKLLDLFSTDLATGATLTEEQKTAAKEKHKNGTKKENKLPTGVHVNLTNVTADAGTTGATSVKAEEKNRVELTADVATLSVGNVAIGVDNAFLDLAHATDIKLDKSLLKGKNVTVGTYLDNNPRNEQDQFGGIDNVAIAASIAISPTTLISGAVNVVMNKVNITGTSGITVTDTDILATGGNVTLEANDRTKAATHLWGIAGSTILGVNTIWSWVQNTHTMGISFENTNGAGINTVSGDRIFVGTKNTTNLSAEAKGVAVGLVSVAVANSKAEDNSSATVQVINTNDGGTYKFDAAQEISFGAYNAPELKAKINNFGVGLVNAMVSYTTALAKSSASVLIGDGNRFNAKNVGFGAYVGNENGKNPTAWVDQFSFGIGGFGLGTAGENATAKTVTSATVNVGNEIYTKESNTDTENETSDVDLSIEAKNYASRKAEAQNIGGSVVKITVNGVDAISDAQDSVSVSAKGGHVKNLDMAATGFSYSDTSAYYFGVDLIAAGAGAKGYNYFKNNADAAVSGNWKAGRMTINATQHDAVDTTSEKNGGGVATYGTMRGIIDTRKDTKATHAVVDVKADTTIQADSIDIQAKNIVDTSYKKKYKYQVQGNGAPILLGASAATSDNMIYKDAFVNIGNNAQIVTSRAQNYNAFSDARLDNAVYSYLWGAIESADSYAKTDAQFTNKVNVGSGAILKTTAANRASDNSSDHSITLSASDNTESRVFAEVHVAALLGITSLADAQNKVVRTNTVTVAKEAFMQSEGDLNLYAGKSQYGNSVLKQGSYAEGYVTVINAGVKAKYTMETSTNNQVVVEEDAVGKAVKNINLQAIQGNVNIYKMAKEYRSDDQSSLRQALPKDSKLTASQNNFVQVDGSLTSGQRNKLVIEINGSEIPKVEGLSRAEGADSKYTVSVTNGKTETEEEDYSDEIKVKTGTRSYANDLANRWEELNKLIKAQGSGNDEIDRNMTSYAGYVMEKELLETKLKALGLMREINDGNGKTTWIPITSGYDITYAELPNHLYASGGTINIASDTLKGSGTITANNAASVTVTNKSNAYLKVNNITIGEIGDGIVFNGVNLSNDDKAIETYQKAGLTLVSTSLDQAGVFINNQPDTQPISVKTAGSETTTDYKPVTTVEIAGKIQAGRGTASISNTSGDIYINGSTDDSHPAGIEGKVIRLTAANGSLTQSYTKGITNISGSPETIFQTVHNSIENNYNYVDKGNGVREKTANLSFEANSELNNANAQAAASAGQGGFIFGDHVFITAEGINVNGLIQSGFGVYAAEVSQDELNAAIQAAVDNDITKAVKVGTETLYKVNNGGRHVKVEVTDPKDERYGTYKYIVQVYYNPKTGKLVTEDIESKGGNVYLTGRIVSTGNGRIVVADGGADISVINNTDKALDVGKISNDNVEGKIVITSSYVVDNQGNKEEKLSRTTYTRNYTETIKDYTQYLKTTDEDAKKDLVSKEPAGSGARTFAPETGSRYYWTKSSSKGGVYEYTYKYNNKENFEKERGKASKDRDSNNYASFEVRNLELGGSGEMLPGTFLNTDEKVKDDDYQLIVTESTVDKGFTHVKEYTTGAWFWENYYDVIQEGSFTATTITESLKADHAIGIGFLGKQDSSITLQSVGSINLTGNVRNTSETATLTAVSTQGNVNQNAGTFLYTNHASIRGKTDVSGISIDALNANQAVNLSVRAETGNADASVRGHVAVGSFTANGNAKLTATGNITQAEDGDGIQASRIDIFSQNGSIGTANDALLVYAGQEASGEDTLSASVNATAAGGINLKQEKYGDMRVGRIRSVNNGDIKLEVNGDFVDALPYNAEEGGIDIQTRVQNWIDTGLIEGNKDESGKVIDNEYLKKLRQNVTDYATEVTNDYNLYTTNKKTYETIVTAPALKEGSPDAAQAKSAFDTAQAAYIAAYKAYKEKSGTEADVKAKKAVYEQAGQVLLQHTKAWDDLHEAETALNETYLAYMNASPEVQADAKTAWEAAQAAYETAKQNFKDASEQQAEYEKYSVAQQLLQPIKKTYQSTTDEEILKIDLKELDRTGDVYLASEYDYVNYLQQKAKYKNFASVDAYLANDETYTKLTTARDNPTYRWTKEDIIYAVNEALINRETGSTDQSTKLANVSGRNITLIGENVGTSTGTQTITVEQLSKGDQNGNHIHYLKQLANTDASDVAYYENAETANWDGYFVIGGRAPLGINATGTVNVTADAEGNGFGDITLAERHASENDITYHGIAVGKIVSLASTPLPDSDSEKDTRDVRILAKGGVTNALQDSKAANIVARNLLVEGGDENIGSEEKPLLVSLEDGALRARSSKSIYIKNFDESSILNIGAVYAGDTVSLNSKAGLGYEAGDPLGIGLESYINVGKHLILTAENGSIGTKNHDTSNPVPLLILNNPGLVIDVTAKNAWLKGRAVNETNPGVMTLQNVDITKEFGAESEGALVLAEVKDKYGETVTSVQAEDIVLVAATDLTVNGNVAVDDTADLTAHAGDITVNGTVDSGQVFITTDGTKAENETGNVEINNEITTENGSISIYTRDGEVTVTAIGGLTAKKTENADKTVDASISITTENGDITSYESLTAADNVTLTSTNGTVTVRDSITATAGSVRASTGKGEVSVQGVTAGTDLSLTTEQGAITANGALKATDEVTLSATTSGAIQVNQQVTGKTITVHTGSGNITIADTAALTATTDGGSITVDTVSGNIELGSAVKADQTVYIEAKSGSVTAEKAIESIDKNVTVTGDNGVTLKDKVTAGTDVTVTSGAGNATLVGA